MGLIVVVQTCGAGRHWPPVVRHREYSASLREASTKTAVGSTKKGDDSPDTGLTRRPPTHQWKGGVECSETPYRGSGGEAASRGIHFSHVSTLLGAPTLPDGCKTATIGLMTATGKIQDTVLITHSPEETEDLGQQLGAQLQPGDLIALSGTLGAGKTCFVRGLARGWGTVERPTSPTFTLINEYHRRAGSGRLFHVDCYRLEGAGDARSTGLEDVLASGDIVVVEWPERIEEMLPGERLWIAIHSPREDDREFRISASGSRAQTLLRALAAP
jgi:tRNA threonylcarbamoyladenosine biosynthesis protein TsaE